MKKTLFLLGMLLLSCVITAQMPTDGNFSSWDWENQNQTNWKRRDGNGWVDINPPFDTKTDQTSLLAKIKNNGDYTKEKGWRLMHAQFDGSYPYFILYNKYTGILRTFIYTESTIVMNGLLTVIEIPESVRKTRLFNAYETFQIALDSKEESTIASVSVLDNNVGSNAWSVSEFIMSSCVGIGNEGISQLYDEYLSISFFAVNDMKMDLKIKGISTPVSVDKLTSFVGTEDNTKVGSTSLTVTQAKAHKIISNGNNMFNEMQESASKIKSDAWEPLKKYKDLVGKTAEIGNYLSALKSLSAGVGAVMGFFDFFNGGMESSSNQLSVGYYHDLTATGTISYNQTIRHTQLKIPGANYSGGVEPWKYNCPMGLFGLSSSVKLHRTSPYVKALFSGYKPKVERNPWGGPDVVVTEKYKVGPLKFINLPVYEEAQAIGFSKKEIIKYLAPDNQTTYKRLQSYNVKIGTDNGIVMQNIPEIRVEDVQIAIVGTLNNKFMPYNSSKYAVELLTPKAIGILNNNGTTTLPGLFHSTYQTNPVFKKLKDEEFIIHKYDEDAGKTVFGTPYISTKELKGKNLTFEAPVGLDVYMSVIIKYTIPNNKEPQIFKARYRFDEVVSTMGKTAYLIDDKFTYPTTFFNKNQENTLSLKLTEKCNESTTKRMTRSLDVEAFDVNIWSEGTSIKNYYINIPISERANVNTYRVMVTSLNGNILLDKQKVAEGETISFEASSSGMGYSDIKVFKITRNDGTTIQKKIY